MQGAGALFGAPALETGDSPADPLFAPPPHYRLVLSRARNTAHRRTHRTSCVYTALSRTRHNSSGGKMNKPTMLLRRKPVR